MRDFKGMKRQRSRNRSGGGGNVGKPQQNANRAFESNGPDGVKIRGAAQHVFEKYQQLARDALTAGDRVLGESYQQHAEHYFRVLRAVQPNRPASDIIGRDAFASGFDIDFEDESPQEADTSGDNGEGDGERQEWRAENRSENRYERPREDRYRDDRPRDGQNRDNQSRDNQNRDNQSRDTQNRDTQNRDNQSRDDRPRDRNFNRDDRPRDDRNTGGSGERVARDDRNGQERVARDDRPRDDRPREDRAREDRPREDRPKGDRNERYRERDRDRGERAADPLAVVEPQATPLTPEPEQSSSPVLRSHDGGVSEAPAFLQTRAAEPKPVEATADGEPRPKVRRRRAPRSFDAAEGESADDAGKVGASEDA